MADRIRVQVQFRRVLWTCPKCGLEEWEDFKMEGGNTYEHTCKNGHWFNQSCGNMKEYNGTVNYSEDEYATVKDEDIATEKEKQALAWLDGVKNPPAYVEPSKAELEQQKAELEAQVASLATQISAKEAIK